MTNKQILSAQKALRALEGTPVKVVNSEGIVFWEVTFDNETYNSFLNVVSAVASQPLNDISYIPDAYDYHREKI